MQGHVDYVSLMGQMVLTSYLGQQILLFIGREGKHVLEVI